MGKTENKAEGHRELAKLFTELAELFDLVGDTKNAESNRKCAAYHRQQEGAVQ